MAGRYYAKSESLLYVTTGEASNTVELAKISPKTVLDGEKPKLIDEWQNATNLWNEIRNEVDTTGLKGQYILTGSSTPNREGINHSGAGRFGKIRLRTMSLFESGDSNGKISLKDICDGKEISASTGEVDLNNLAHLIIRGGFPANIGFNLEDGSWCAFEIKLGAKQIDDAAKNLLAIKEKIQKENGKVPKIMCIICGMSNAAY